MGLPYVRAAVVAMNLKTLKCPLSSRHTEKILFKTGIPRPVWCIHHTRCGTLCVACSTSTTPGVVEHTPGVNIDIMINIMMLMLRFKCIRSGVITESACLREIQGHALFSPGNSGLRIAADRSRTSSNRAIAFFASCFTWQHHAV